MMSLTTLLLITVSANPDFSRDIRPILADKCFACHGPDAEQRKAGLRLDVAEQAVDLLASGERAIVPGDTANSELVRRILSQDSDLVMPPEETKKPLTAEEKTLLEEWVAAGAKFNQHWAFVAPQRPALPAVKTVDWVKNEIDAFVLAGLEEAQMRPSAVADRITLIRRLSLDLRGLPPTVAEVDAFLHDQSPHAYERLVDGLLASEHFGERMAQAWLDLARFGDTNGYHADSDRTMWLYRDYVINAFNENKPYSQFMLENVAGDLMPDVTDETRIASGFNRCNTFNEEGGADPDEFYVAYAVDRANTIGQVFLGLTVGCAQCHDHKYDPITQKDYYQLFAFFNSVEGEVGAGGPGGYHGKELPPLLPVATQEQRDILDAFPEQTKALKKQLEVELARFDQPLEEFDAALQQWIKE
ncbi:MAG: DUF1549 domain-containing protein, partial [Pirellulaceae bacterium]|nr:DUF1549 domain-containing protein [Pirellulaceae bacterium]